MVTLTEDCKGMPVKDVVDDVEAYTDAVLRQPFNNAREKRHIGAQTMGLAFCALVLLVRSGIDFLNGYRAGGGPIACVTTLDLGHLLACIAILVGVRILVAGNRKIDFEDVSKMRKRKAFAGVAGELAVFGASIAWFRAGRGATDGIRRYYGICSAFACGVFFLAVVYKNEGSL